MDYAKESLRLHGEWKGKIEVVTRVPAENKDDLSLAYTPGVAQPCLEIQKDVNKSYDLTRRWNMCLVVTDGSAILGLGNIGPEAGMPVMEGKCALFKAFGDVDAFPLCIKSNDVDEIVNTIYLISGSFGGVNLEDISAPRCFEIEKKLKEKCDIPIFHDDQHGTAIVVSAGLTNALRLVGKKFSEAKVVINGAGSAGISICKLLLELGIGDVVMVDRKGILAPGEEWMNPAQKEIAEKTNKEQLHGDLKAAMKGRDIFVGVSAPNIVTAEMVSTMADDAIVFAMANPTPEIMPDEARKGGARVIATGRSDFPNQINNVLVFPGVFRGAFDVRASDINEEMKIAAAKATVKDLIHKYGVTLISVGNGTASRESEQIIVEILKEIPEKVAYVITNEAGASVYSASKLATEEFPNFDVGQRSAASIARRLQDPLAELVKITPQSIGVGQYQHDMNQKKLGEALSGVVEDCVNKVGVDLNTASASLLEYISGISKVIAKNIVAYREENGRFESRRELLKVAKLGPKAFEQCAGFARITGGKNPLDATSVHPESYEAAQKVLEKLGYKPEDITAGKLSGISRQIKNYKKLAEELGVGEPTLRDIVKELEKPARDPRDEMPKPVLRTDVLDMKDLKEGMILKGTVRNVIDFGAFVDIGVHQDGLVHISEMTERYIKHPLEAVSVGDVVDVRVIGVDLKKKRISLSMKGIK